MDNHLMKNTFSDNFKIKIKDISRYIAQVIDDTMLILNR